MQETEGALIIIKFDKFLNTLLVMEIASQPIVISSFNEFTEVHPILVGIYQEIEKTSLELYSSLYFDGKQSNTPEFLQQIQKDNESYARYVKPRLQQLLLNFGPQQQPFLLTHEGGGSAKKNGESKKHIMQKGGARTIFSDTRQANIRFIEMIILDNIQKILRKCYDFINDVTYNYGGRKGIPINGDEEVFSIGQVHSEKNASIYRYVQDNYDIESFCYELLYGLNGLITTVKELSNKFNDDFTYCDYEESPPPPSVPQVGPGGQPSGGENWEDITMTIKDIKIVNLFDFNQHINIIRIIFNALRINDVYGIKALHEEYKQIIKERNQVQIGGMMPNSNSNSDDESSTSSDATRLPDDIRPPNDEMEVDLAGEGLGGGGGPVIQQIGKKEPRALFKLLSTIIGNEDMMEKIQRYKHEDAANAEAAQVAAGAGHSTAESDDDETAAESFNYDSPIGSPPFVSPILNDSYLSPPEDFTSEKLNFKSESDMSSPETLETDINEAKELLGYLLDEGEETADKNFKKKLEELIENLTQVIADSQNALSMNEQEVEDEQKGSQKRSRVRPLFQEQILELHKKLKKIIEESERTLNYKIVKHKTSDSNGNGGGAVAGGGASVAQPGDDTELERQVNEANYQIMGSYLPNYHFGGSNQNRKKKSRTHKKRIIKQPKKTYKKNKHFFQHKTRKSKK